MKRNSLTTALLAGLAGAAGLASTAQAINLNPDGLGQVLVYPYYTVNNGNDTYVSIVNTTNRGKAVKVRFLEGRNSKEVLDFNLYMSPYDVWAGAAISLDANGPGNLLTRDTSCTVPAIRTNTSLQQLADGTRYVPFRNFQYSGTNNDNGGQSLIRTREGHLEVIEMGTLQAGTAATQVLEEVTHTSASGAPNTGVPANCNLPINDWDNISGAWGGLAGNRQLNIDLPTGGLYGAIQIINVANGTIHSYDADAIEGFYGGTAAPGGLHFAPGSTRPALNDASNGSLTLTSFVFQSTGTIIQSSWANGIGGVGTPDAISAVYMHDAIFNEFNTETAIGGQSEWVVTFPTKRFYVDTAAVAILPFTDPFRDDGHACETVAPSFWDREELPTLAPQGSVDFSPPPPLPPGAAPNSLCFEAQVISFNQTITAIDALTNSPTAIFGSNYAANLSLKSAGVTADKGHVRISFPTVYTGSPVGAHTLTSADGDVYSGLPVTGFWSANYVNSAAQPGKLANYSAALRHRASRSIVGS